MKNLQLLCSIMIFLFSQNAFSQYGAGYGNGGMGRTGGMNRNNNFGSQPQSSYKQSYKDIAKQETHWMKKNLNLTEDQVTIMDEINLDYAEQRDNLITEATKGSEGAAPSQEKIAAVRPKIDELKRRQEEEFKRLLKPEQWEIYQAKQAEMKAKREKEMKQQKRY